MILDFRDIAEYIIDHYKNKVIEVGVGNLPQIALLLKEKLDIIVTDVNDQNFSNVLFYKDDIFDPDLKIYQNASLIYSIRPPIDIQDAIAKTASEVGSDLIIRPFGSEKADLRKYFNEYTLINYKKARFYLYKTEDLC